MIYTEPENDVVGIEVSPSCILRIGISQFKGGIPCWGDLITNPGCYADHIILKGGIHKIPPEPYTYWNIKSLPIFP